MNRDIYRIRLISNTADSESTGTSRGLKHDIIVVPCHFIQLSRKVHVVLRPRKPCNTPPIETRSRASHLTSAHPILPDFKSHVPDLRDRSAWRLHEFSLSNTLDRDGITGLARSVHPYTPQTSYMEAAYVRAVQLILSFTRRWEENLYAPMRQSLVVSVPSTY